LPAKEKPVDRFEQILMFFRFVVDQAKQHPDKPEIQRFAASAQEALDLYKEIQSDTLSDEESEERTKRLSAKIIASKDQLLAYFKDEGLIGL
jgi:hypothetical protein